ncbi:MAG: uracil-DNA glycosylase family protein [Hyphomicrobium sp.]
MDEVLDELIAAVRACRRCIDDPVGPPLPHAPRPVLRASAGARLAVCGQAPGIRVHRSGVPFTDPSGVRLRAWMGVDEAEFYDTARVAILPMGFCFPGHDDKGSDRPPRRECAPLWRDRILARLPDIELMLLVGAHAQRWHLAANAAASLTEKVAGWRAALGRDQRPRMIPLPHPSWRNNGWIAAHPWFEAELLPVLRLEVRRVLNPAGPTGSGA